MCGEVLGRVAIQAMVGDCMGRAFVAAGPLCSGAAEAQKHRPDGRLAGWVHSGSDPYGIRVAASGKFPDRDRSGMPVTLCEMMRVFVAAEGGAK